jgi:hypothetical protein
MTSFFAKSKKGGKGENTFIESSIPPLLLEEQDPNHELTQPIPVQKLEEYEKMIAKNCRNVKSTFDWVKTLESGKSSGAKSDRAST